jgi:D-aspartate ligase
MDHRVVAAPPPPAPLDTRAFAGVPRSPGAIPGVVIVLGMSTTGLGALRLLARRGVRCWGADSDLDLPGFRSRYCHRRIHVPTGMSPAELAGFLRATVYGETRRAIVLPTSDRYVKLLSDARDDLGDRVAMALPPRSVVDDLLDKRRFADVAARAGLRTPRTALVRDVSELAKVAAHIGYPAVVKPRSPAEQQGGHLPKAVVVANDQEARDLVATLGEMGPGDDLVVQEFVPGGDCHHVSVALALDARSRPIATFVSRKRRQGNAGAGVGTFVESHRDDEAAAMARGLLERIGYVGVAEMELKRHARTGELFAIEVNPRLWSQVTLPAAMGVDFAYAYCRVAAGAPDNLAIEPSPYGCTWQDLWSDLYWTFSRDGYFRKGEVSLPSFLRQTLFTRAHAYFAWHDPGPALGRAWEGLSRTARWK